MYSAFEKRMAITLTIVAPWSTHHKPNLRLNATLDGVTADRMQPWSSNQYSLA
jgi:hypothetical protein